ncbi:MAG: M28 family metallopeptidase [Pyrinomonadaceae bacterium]
MRQLTASPVVALLVLSVSSMFTFHVAAAYGNSSRVKREASALTPAASHPRAVSQSRPDVFDGERAFGHVRKMVETGPRPAGSKELARVRDYLIGELKSCGLKVSKDEFQTSTPVGTRLMTNLTADLPGASTDFIIIASHYDTKPFKDFRFVGANDGGSSTGVLLELARVLAATPRQNRLSYRFVFFDGEEAFCRGWDDCGKPGSPDNTYGSRHYLARLRRDGELRQTRALILLDMIGYSKLELGRDTMSTPWLMDAIWQTARELGREKQFVARAEGVGGDDHEAYLSAGVPAVDLIQLSTYPHWHTRADTLDKISPQSLKTVGDVVLASLPRIEEKLLSGEIKNRKSSEGSGEVPPRR